MFGPTESSLATKAEYQIIKAIVCKWLEAKKNPSPVDGLHLVFEELEEPCRSSTADCCLTPPES